jgi:hypothetical protein
VFLLPPDFSGYRSVVASAHPRPTVAAVLLLLVVVPLCGLLIIGTPAAPFIYFRF